MRKRRRKSTWDLSVGGDWPNEYEDVTYIFSDGGVLRFTESDGTTHILGPAVPYWLIERKS